MDYIILIAFIKSIVDGIRSVVPVLNEWMTKALVVVLSAVFSAAYGLNALAAVGKASNWPQLDFVVTVIAVAIATMTGNDILALLSKSQRGAGPSVSAAPTAPANPDKKV